MKCVKTFMRARMVSSVMLPILGCRLHLPLQVFQKPTRTKARRHRNNECLNTRRNARTRIYIQIYLYIYLYIYAHIYIRIRI